MPSPIPHPIVTQTTLPDRVLFPPWMLLEWRLPPSASAPPLISKCWETDRTVVSEGGNGADRGGSLR
jgi:hypothetical protein